MRNILLAAIAIAFLSVPLVAFPFCFEEAGRTYDINPFILCAIAEVESGFRQEAINRNGNGSYDYGIMQINSGWYGVLGRDTWLALSDPCTNVKVGAWILRRCINRFGYTWDAIGCYNGRAKTKRTAYAWKVYTALLRCHKEGANARCQGTPVTRK